MIRAALLCMMLPGVADAACRQALALGLDVSGSVDAAEYRLQLGGVATALNSEAVREVLFEGPGSAIRLSVYEWSGPGSQTIILPWTDLTGPDDLIHVTAVLNGHQRQDEASTTAIGSALLTGFALLDQQADCWRRTLDLSGDGFANTGPRPQDIAASETPAGVTVNGLVIGAGELEAGDQRFADLKELQAYYSTYVIRGPDAFVETALGFEAYAEAMERKLLRELQSIILGQAKGGAPSPAPMHQ